jgi:hypothetical protein
MFVAGFASICPPLKALASQLPGTDERHRPQCERVLERMLRVMPRMPLGVPAEAVTRLSSVAASDLRGLIVRHGGPEEQSLHALWRGIWEPIDDPRARDFAVRAAVVLTELFRLSSEPSERPAAS